MVEVFFKDLWDNLGLKKFVRVLSKKKYQLSSYSVKRIPYRTPITIIRKFDCTFMLDLDIVDRLVEKLMNLTKWQRCKRNFNRIMTMDTHMRKSLIAWVKVILGEIAWG